MYAKVNIDKQFIQAIYNSIYNKINQSAVQMGSKSVGVQTQVSLLHMRLADLGLHACTGIYLQLDHELFNRDFLNEKASETNLPNLFIVGRPVFFINNVNL